MILTGAAAARLYDDHVDAIHTLLARRIGITLATTVTAETFELALGTWERFDVERDAERSFLFGAASAVLRRHLDLERAHVDSLRIRRESGSSNVGDPLVSAPRRVRNHVVDHEADRNLGSDAVDGADPDFTEPSAGADQDSFDARTMRAVAELPADDRDVLLLSLWEACSPRAVADIMDLPVGAVRSALGRIRRELKNTASRNAADEHDDTREMRVLDVVHAVRPTVAPIPLTERRMIRETLFAVGRVDTSRSIRTRSQSGAVVSTAPHGIPVRPDRRPTRTGSLPRMAAGLAVVAALGVVAWSMLPGGRGDDDSARSEDPLTTSVTPTIRTTVAPTTLAPLVRTGATRDRPIVLPVDLLTVDEVTISPPNPGSSAMLLNAPDDTMMWMVESDGDPPIADGLDVRRIGSVGVAVSPEPPAPGGAAAYRLATPCGLVVLIDAPGAAPDRPAVGSLFSSMSLDGTATIDVSLPTGFSVFDIGDSEIVYTARFRIPDPAAPDPAAPDATRSVQLVQIPDGSFAQLAFGGRQLQPTTFLGGPAHIDAAPSDPSLVSIFWKDGPTVFNVSSSELTVDEIASFVDGLEPARPADWTQRFSTPVPAPAALESTCAPQPGFGPTLDP